MAPSWRFYMSGEWSIPHTLREIQGLLATRQPAPFLMAGGVTDRQLDELRTYPGVIGLALVSPHVTTGATVTLRASPGLRELILCGPPITDVFLAGLAGMTGLERVMLVETACRGGVRQFLRALPRCMVYRGNPGDIYPVSTLREPRPVLPDV